MQAACTLNVRTVHALAAVLILGVLESSHCARGASHDVLAEAESLRVQYEKPAAERAVALYRGARAAWQAGNPRDAARAAQGLGATYHQLGLLGDSMGALADALMLAERAQDRLLEAEISADLGFAEAWIGDRAATLERAEDRCQKALIEARMLAGLRGEAKALACLGEVIYSRGGNLEPALAMQRDAEAAWARVGNLSGVAQARLSQGYLYSDLRRFDEARQAFDGARSIWEGIGDRRGLAITLVADARLLERRGEYQVSLDKYQQALELLEPIGDAVWQGSCLAGLATIHQFLSDYPRALAYFQKALQFAQASGQKVFAMDMLTAVGNAHLASGDEAAAIAWFERAFKLAVELENPRWQAWTLKYIGAAHLSRRSAVSAQRSFRRALDLVNGLNEKWLEAEALSGLGETFELMDQPDRAYRYFADSVAVSRRTDDRVLVAKGLYSLGSLEARRGHWALARANVGAALSDYERLFGPAHPLIAQSKATLAGVDLASGRFHSALATSIEAERTSLEHLRFTVRYLPERQALAFASRRPRGMDVALTAAAMGAPEDVARVLDLVIQSRGVVLDELAARGRLDGPVEPRLADLQMRTRRARQRFANVLVRSLEGAVARDQFDEARRDMEEAERSLASQSLEARAEMARSPAGLDAVRAALPEGSALVSFVQYARHERPAGGSAAPPQPVPSFAAFVLRAGSKDVALVRLGPVSEIERLIAEWRGEAAGRTRLLEGSHAAAEQSYRDAGGRLRGAVWDRLARSLRGASRVFVVPDGALGLVTFDGLPIGRTAYVLEQSAPLHYLTAERDLVSMIDGPRQLSSGILALGGPGFDDNPIARSSTATSPVGAGDDVAMRSGRTPCGSLRTLSFEPLAGTLQEAQEVSRLWPTTLGAARTLVGREASEQAFKQQAHNHRVLHLATHGFFLDGSCLPESGGAGTRGVGGLSGTRPVENPLRLSGLALAGANRRALAGPDEDDGILTAEEVASLDLQGVEWAVLSACDTGVGEIKAGEGVFGLRRAFQVAGARTVVMSLWSVDDQATRAWMRALYEGRFQKKLSTADAVHQASLTVLRDRRAKGQSTHPFYWAAFVAAGDWR